MNFSGKCGSRPRISAPSAPPLALAGAAFLLSGRGDPPPARELRLQLAPPQGTRFVSVPALSPDGRTIAFVAAPVQGGPGRMWIRPLAAATATELPGTDDAIFPFWSSDSPRWRADGREICFLSESSRMMVVTFMPGTPPAIGKPETLFEVRVLSHPNRFQFESYGYDVIADGSRFLVNRVVAEPENSMTVVVDWSPAR